MATNVQPGDFAKIVHVFHPALSGNIGCMVYVLRPAPTEAYRSLDVEMGEVLWIVEVLETVKIGFEGMKRTAIIFPGREASCNDKCLKKVPPPGDWEELFKPEDVEEKKDKELVIVR